MLTDIPQMTPQTGTDNSRLWHRRRGQRVGHNTGCGQYALTIQCMEAAAGLSCPSSGERQLTHVAAVLARFQSVVSTRRSRRNVRFSPDNVGFTLNNGHSEGYAGLPLMTRRRHSGDENYGHQTCRISKLSVHPGCEEIRSKRKKPPPGTTGLPS